MSGRTPDHDPETGLPIGPRVDPLPIRSPERVTLRGRYVELSPLNPQQHGDALWDGIRGPTNDRLWRYLPDGPFPDRTSFDANLEFRARSESLAYFAILDGVTEHALGWAALMRIEPTQRCIEVGSILYSPALQRTRGATEAMYLLARYVFEDLGYRRYEWKCDSLNAPSRAAARRLGFTFEGIFREHMIVKNRSRDTAWFSMLDVEWPSRRAGFEGWLDPSNFDAQGRQRGSLSELSTDPQPTPG